MADTKASALIDWLKGHIGDGYVYGAVGEACTVALLQAKQRQYGASMGEGYYQKGGDYNKGLCAAWLGKWVADCSGFIKAGRKALSGVWRDVSAQGTYDQCTKRGTIGTMPLIPGCTVYMWSDSKHRMGHVGTYIGGGQVIEARGVRYGIVVTKLSGRAWTHWGLLDWVDYNLPADNGGQPDGSGAAPDAGDATNPKPDDDDVLRRGSTGPEVGRLQKALNAHGAKLIVDNDFGPLTDKAVRAFQSAHELAVDGIVGPKTWAALSALGSIDYPSLSQGSAGQYVKLAQTALRGKGYSPGDIDGKYGPKTEAAVRAFKKAAKLVPVAGGVGPRTWAALLAA